MTVSRWTAAEANDWAARAGRAIGCNYIAAAASNPIEFWSTENFDEATIGRELDLAQDLGFDALRVYLHDLAYAADPEGFLARMDRFLAVAATRGLRVMWVIFDSVWHPFPRPGRQPEPEPGVHNAGWVQSPGIAVLRDAGRFAALEPYVRATVARFRDDPRVLAWDVWNEPDNENPASYGLRDLHGGKALIVAPLLEKAFAWARAGRPSQPLTSAVWQGDWTEEALSPIARLQLDLSDIVTFHCYAPADETRARIETLRRFGRPILCTEYLARPLGSTFEALLPLFREEGVGAFSWGLVTGRTQTNLPWSTWQAPAQAEPAVWFHDIFRADHTPWSPAEVAAIRRINASRE